MVKTLKPAAGTPFITNKMVSDMVVGTPNAQMTVPSLNRSATSTNSYIKDLDYQNPDGLLNAINGVMLKSDPIVKEVLSSTKVSEVPEVGNCIRQILGEGQSLINATKYKPGFFVAMFSKVKDNVEAVKAQYQSMQTKIEEIGKRLDKAVATEKDTISLMKRKVETAQQNLVEINNLKLGCETYKGILSGIIEKLKASSDAIGVNQAAAYMTLLDGAIADLHSYSLLAKQSIMEGNNAITTSYSAVYTLTTKTRIALKTFADGAAQYIRNQKTKETNDLTEMLVTATEQQMIRNSIDTRNNARAAAKNLARPAVNVDALSQVTENLIGSLTDIQEEFKAAEKQRIEDRPKLISLEEQMDRASLNR